MYLLYLFFHLLYTSSHISYLYSYLLIQTLFCSKFIHSLVGGTAGGGHGAVVAVGVIGGDALSLGSGGVKGTGMGTHRKRSDSSLSSIQPSLAPSIQPSLPPTISPTHVNSPHVKHFSQPHITKDFFSDSLSLPPIEENVLRAQFADFHLMLRTPKGLSLYRGHLIDEHGIGTLVYFLGT